MIAALIRMMGRPWREALTRPIQKGLQGLERPRRRNGKTMPNDETRGS